MLKIGLTGGISTGKSTVSQLLKNLGAVIIDADVIARQIVEPNKPAYLDIISYFGEQILNEDLTINRKQLGSIVFNDKEKLKVLNQFTHPRVQEEMKKQIEQGEKDLLNAIILDIPLLVGSKSMELVDTVWVVTLDKEAQLSRLMQRNKLTEEEALVRIQSQLPLEELEKYADVLIYNSGTEEELATQVEVLWNTIKGGS